MSPMINLAALFLPLLTGLPQQGDALQTVAEQSGFKATARHGDVVALCKEMARKYPNAQYSELGLSAEGRPLPMLILADPPVHNADEAARSGKLIVLAIGNIHAGEVCGKEALPMLARETPGFHGSRAVQGSGDRPGADLQRRRQRASLEDEPPGAERTRGRHGPASQCPRPRPEPRLHQARSTRDPRPGQVFQYVEAAPVHRHAYHQRVAPPIHDHLRRAEESGGRPQGDQLHAQRIFPQGNERFRERQGSTRIITATSTAITPSGRAFPRRGGTARLMSDCETGCQCCPRRMRTPRSRIACWPPVISCASA